MRNVLLLMPVLLAGCQSYEKAIDEICEAPTRCEQCSKVAPDQKMRLIADHIDRKVHNREASKMFEAMAMMDPESRIRVLREAASKAGRSDCPLADSMVDGGM